MNSFLFLKRIRIAVSLIFLVLIAFIFIDVSSLLSATIINGILYFQFLPSILKFINLLGLVATGFVVVLILNLLFGRVYCSFLCPMGALQDIFHYFSNKLRKRKRRKFISANNCMRYSFLIIPLVFFLFGNILLFNLLDPYSNFGKIISNLVRPVFVELNNLLSIILERQEIFTVKPVQFKNVSWLSTAYSIFIFGLVSGMAIWKGRLFCNTICPVGTFLGIISRISVFRIKLDQSACTSCGICGNNCKSDCIDTTDKKVDFSRCVGCLDCLSVCPTNGVKFSLRYLPENKSNGSLTERRNFIKKSALIPIGLATVSKDIFSQELKHLQKGLTPVIHQYPVTPPGSISIQYFNDRCTACHLCVSVCPTQVLQPSFLQYGFVGMMQPRMDYKASFCNFECTICTDVCPTGAINPLELEVKKLTQIGKSHFIKENCVVFTHETACGACSEHCPTKAVNMVPYEKKAGLMIPEVNNDICVGCGACEYACPTDPKSIYVEGNPVHLIAQKPPDKELTGDKKILDDFPF